MKTSIMSEKTAKPVGPYSQAIVVNGFIFVSMMLPLDAERKICEGGIVEQTKLVLENISRVLEAGGASLSDIVKTTVYLSDIKMFTEFNRVYAAYFNEPFPARSTIEAKLPQEALVAIDAVAVKR